LERKYLVCFSIGDGRSSQTTTREVMAASAREAREAVHRQYVGVMVMWVKEVEP